MPTEESLEDGKAFQLMESVATGPRSEKQVKQAASQSCCETTKTGRIRRPEDILDIPVAPQTYVSLDLHPKDVYLIEAYVASNADLLVTTDETLFDKVAQRRTLYLPNARVISFRDYGANRLKGTVSLAPV